MSSLRFTDEPPPRNILENIANWVHAYGEEGRKGQDETTIKPQRRQDRIDEDTSYTTADIWLPNDDVYSGLLWLSSADVTAMDVYEGDCIWHVRRNGITGIWEIDGFRNSIGARLDDVDRFPLRYCSRLQYNKRPIKGIIKSDGKWSDWVIQD